MVEIWPIPSRMHISPEAWAATPVEFKEYAIRRWRELEQGLAVAKDARCGRPKSHREHPPYATSFYALHCLEMEIWRRPDIAAPYEIKAEALRAKLAPDVERMAQNDALEPYHDLAKRQGTTLAAVLRGYIDMENLLKRDFDAGFEQICKNIGIDPVALAKAILSNDALAADGSIPDEAA